MVGTRGALHQRVETARVAGMEAIEYGLVVAAQVRGNLRGALAAGTGEQDLAATQHNGSFARRPAVSASRSASVSGRTTIGVLIAISVAHSRLPTLERH